MCHQLNKQQTNSFTAYEITNIWNKENKISTNKKMEKGSMRIKKCTTEANIMHKSHFKGSMYLNSQEDIVPLETWNILLRNKWTKAEICPNRKVYQKPTTPSICPSSLPAFWLLMQAKASQFLLLSPFCLLLHPFLYGMSQCWDIRDSKSTVASYLTAKPKVC